MHTKIDFFCWREQSQTSPLMEKNPIHTPFSNALYIQILASMPVALAPPQE